MSVRIIPTSRLQYASLIVADGVEFWDFPEYPDIPTSSADILYVVKSTDRLDTLAYSYYGDVNLWWVIALANDIQLIPTDLAEGMQIRIPAPTTVQTKIVNLNRKL